VKFSSLNEKKKRGGGVAGMRRAEKGIAGGGLGRYGVEKKKNVTNRKPEGPLKAGGVVTKTGRGGRMKRKKKKKKDQDRLSGSIGGGGKQGTYYAEGDGTAKKEGKETTEYYDGSRGGALV